MKPNPEVLTATEGDTQFTSEPELPDLRDLSSFLEEQLTGVIITKETDTMTLKDKLQLQLGETYPLFRSLVLHKAACSVVEQYRSDTSTRVKRMKNTLKEEQTQAEKQGLLHDVITQAGKKANEIARSWWEMQTSIKGEITGGTDPHAFLDGTNRNRSGYKP